MDERIGFLETQRQDGQVEKSSKRLIGVISFSIGSAMLCGLGVVSFFIKAADPGTIQTVGIAFLSAGAGLLGLGVLDGIGSKK